MSVRHLRLRAALVLTLLATPVDADELQLKNGGRFIGTIVGVSGGTLTFTTTYGTLSVPINDVVALRSDRDLLVSANDTPPRLQPPGPIALNGLTALIILRAPVVVDGTANAGFTSTGGNTDVTSLRLDSNLVARWGANRYTASAAINRAEDRDIDTAESWNAALNYDRFLTRRLFVTANSVFAHDAFRDIDLRTALGAGVGYQIVESPRVRLTANAGVGYVDENLNERANDSYTAAREAARVEIFVVGRRVQLFHEHDGYFGLAGNDNRFVRTQNGIRIGLVGGLVTTLQMDVDYDGSPVPGRRRIDRTSALTFGYRF